MAVLALGVIGAAGAGSVGISAGLGYLIGTTVGNLLFPKTGPDQEGPRLSDTAVSSSAYGNMLPINFGTVRIGGQMIWATEIQEIKETEKVGGKGGGTKVTNYSYYGNFAMSFGEGVAADVLRIWAGGKLILDKTGTDPAALQDLGSPFVHRFYSGGEDQLPDPLIETDVDGRLGAGSTPAYRGQAYIVFEQLPLANFGNTLPQITAEIAYKENPAASAKVALTYDNATVTTGRQSRFLGVDWDRRLVYTYDGTVITRWDMNTGDELSRTDYNFSSIRVLTTTKDLGGILMTDGASNSRRLNYVDPDSMAVTAQFGTGNSGLSNTTTSFVGAQYAATIRVFDPVRGYRYYAGIGSELNDVGILELPNMEYLWGDGEELISDLTAVGPGKEGNGFSDLWFANGSNMIRARVSVGAYYSVLLGGTRGVERTAFSVPGISIFQVFVDEVDGNIIVVGSGKTAKVDSETGAVIWTAEIAPSDVTTGNSAQQNVLTNQKFGFIHGFTSSRRFVILNTVTGDIVFDEDLGTGSGLTGNQTYSAELNAVIFGASSDIYGIARLDKAAAQVVPLSDIVTALGDKVGYDTVNDFDVTELTDDVIGFALGRPAALRRWLEMLSTTYFFEAAQSDDKVKFRKKQKASSLTVSSSDLLFLDEDRGQVTNSVRAQEVELARKLDVRYIEQAKDYQAGLQSSQRIRNPVRTQESSEIKTLELPIVMDAQQSKRIAERLLFELWLERDGLSFSMPWRHISLDPTDVVTINQDSNVFVQRIAENRIGANLRLDISSVAHDSAIFDSTVLADQGQALPQVLPTNNLTFLTLMDIPLLRPQDDTSALGLRLHFAMSGVGQVSWGGALLRKGNDPITLETVAQSTNEAVRVSALTALPDPVDAYVTDETSVLDIRVVTGDPDLFETVTQLQMLNGANNLYIGGEIIQFRDVQVLTINTLRLTGLLRARRGTDFALDGHAIGETGVLLQTTTVSSIVLGTGELNALRYYKGVGFGELEQATLAKVLASTGAAEKPFSPANIMGTPNAGDIDLAWFRRTRLDGSFLDGTGEVPLGEEEEEYELEVLNRSAQSVLRTFTGLTTPAFTLTAAEIALIQAGTTDTSLTVVNPGAETGDLTGWTKSNTSSNNGMSATTDSPHTGSWAFRMSAFELTVAYHQDITLNQTALDKIAEGGSNFVLSWWGLSILSGADSNRTWMILECYDEEDNLVATTPSTPRRNSVYTQYTLSVIAPLGTVRVRLHIRMDRNDGGVDPGTGHLSNNAGVRVDDIVVTLGFPPTDETTIKVYQMSDIVGRGFPGFLELDL